MDFSEALVLLKTGHRVARKGWNGKGMFIFLVAGSQFKVSRPPLMGIYPEGTEINYHAHIDMKTADDMVVPWLCSQTDMLADDWEVAEALSQPPRNTITVNGVDHIHLAEFVSYKELVAMADLNTDVHWSMMVNYPNGKGITPPFNSTEPIVVSDGMRVSIANTGNA